MSTSSVKVTSVKALERASKRLSEVPGGVEKALMRAINHETSKLKTLLKKRVREHYSILDRDVEKTLSVSKATRSNLEAEIVSRGPALGLHHYRYSPKGEDTTGANRKRVRVSVRREGGMKPLGQAFVWRGKIMQRVGKDRFPVEKLSGPSIPSIIGNPEIAEGIEEMADEMIADRIDHEVKNILKV